MKKGISILLMALFVIASCSKSSDPGGGGGGGNGGGSGGGSTNCSGVTNNKFATDVSPIIQSSCALNAGCHGAGAPTGTNGPGELLTYSQISSARALIKTAVANGTMPKTGTLTTAQKNSIICWVDGGGLNN